MKTIRTLTVITFIIFFGAVVNSCSKDSYGSSGDPSGIYNISIQNMAFSPASTTMLRGGTVKWTNNDNMNHTVTSDDGTSFSSGTIPPGGTFSYTSTANGTFTYHCTIHPAMTGTLYVVTK